MLHLGVNIDHVATLRQARRGKEPDVLMAAGEAASGGADAITVHLREDRRHIQDSDVFRLREHLTVRLNFEMAVTDEMIAIAEKLKPSDCCLVPEKRTELTTEGGLDVRGQCDRVTKAVERLLTAGIRPSLFIDPDHAQIDAALKTGAPVIELHTGCYAEAEHHDARAKELRRLRDAVCYAHNAGLCVNAGHGLNYHNVQAIAAILELRELNIGHSIVSRAVFTGLRVAVAEMQSCMQQARLHASVMGNHP
jgi:pyridoxine 5-phosphate synthase